MSESLIRGCASEVMVSLVVLLSLAVGCAGPFDKTWTENYRHCNKYYKVNGRNDRKLAYRIYEAKEDKIKTV